MFQYTTTMSHTGDGIISYSSSTGCTELLYFFHSFFSKSHWEEMPSTGLIRMSNILFVCADTHSSEKVCGIGPYTAIQRQVESHHDMRLATEVSLMKSFFPPKAIGANHPRTIISSNLHSLHPSPAALSSGRIPTSIP